MKRIIFFLYLSFLILPFFANSKTVYCTVSGSGNHTGTSWGNSCSFSAAVYGDQDCNCGNQIAACGDQIWLAKGNYTDNYFDINTATDYQEGFRIMCDVYGGFAGSETTLSQRNPTTNLTIISGVNDAVHLHDIVIRPCSDPVTIDGINFQNDHITIPGPGVNFVNSNFLLTSFDLSDVFYFNAQGCTFKNGPSLRFAVNTGGSFTNCLFQNLSGSFQDGGAASGSALHFTKCIFKNNWSSGYAGGAINGGIILSVDNCLFVGNGCAGNGGAITVNSNDTHIFMNTFVNNNAYGSPNPNYPNSNAVENNGGYNLNLANNIMTGGNTGTAVLYYNNDAANYPEAVVSNNLTSDGTANGLLNGQFVDPLFNSDYTLQVCSPAINIGNNSYEDGQTTDLAGHARNYANGTVDIGCYEYQGAKLEAILSASSTSICPGSQVTLHVAFIAGTASYDWVSTGGMDVITSTADLTITPSGTSTYSVAETAAGCVLISNNITVTVSAALVAPTMASYSPVVSQICSGDIVSLTANPGSGGASGCTDVYRYSLNGGNTWTTYNVGSNINTTGATGSVQIEGQRGGCACPSSAWSSIGAWGVNPILPVPTVVINTNPAVIQGQAAVFTAVASNAGNSPTYHWTRNGTTVGSNSSTYTDNAPLNGETVAVTVISNATGCLPATNTATTSVSISVLSLTISDSLPCYGYKLTTSINASNISSLTWWYDGTFYYQDLKSVYPTWGAGTAVAGAHGSGTALNQLSSPQGIIKDGSGNLYIADARNNRVVKWANGASTGVVVAGGNGAGNAANQLHSPSAVGFDGSGNMYVLDRQNYRVQRFPAGSTGATNGTTVFGGNGSGSGTNQISDSYGFYVYTDGTVIISDAGNNRVVIWATGQTNWTLMAGGNGAGSARNQLSSPMGIAPYQDANVTYLYIADYGNNRVQVWEYSGSGTAPANFVNGHNLSSNATAAGGNGSGSANNQLSHPQSIILGNNLDLYITDASNYRVQVWRAGKDTGATILGGTGQGSGSNQFNYPFGLFVDGTTGVIYVSDTSSTTTGTFSRVNKFTPTFTTAPYIAPYPGQYFIQTISFDGTTLNSDTLTIADKTTTSVSISANAYYICPGANVRFTATSTGGGTAPVYKWYVNGTQVATGSVYSTTNLNTFDVVNCVLTSNDPCASSTQATSNGITMQSAAVSVNISASPSNSICAGAAATFKAQVANGNSTGTYKWFNNATQVGTDSLYTGSSFNNGDIVTCVYYSTAGCNNQASVTSNAITMQVATDNISAAGTCVGNTLTASLAAIPAVLQWKRNDTLVRTVNPKWNANAITAAGSPFFNHFDPLAVFVDKGQNVYVADYENREVLKYAPGDTNGVVVAGGNGLGFTDNQLYLPQGLYVDDTGNVYVADYGWVSKWPPAAPGSLTSTLVAGSRQLGAGSGPGQLSSPADITFDAAGNLFVADLGNYRVQKFAPGATNAVTVAGGHGSGPAANQTEASSMAVDAGGNVYVVDYNSQRVQKWAPGATSGVVVAGGNGAGQGAKQLYYPKGLALDAAGNVYVGSNSDRIQMWTPVADSGITVAGGNSNGPAANQINPWDLLMSPTGDIYVADRGAQRIQKFTVSGIKDTLTAAQPGVYTAHIISFGGCSLTSNTDSITLPNVPAVTITTNAGNVFCPGTPLTFTANPVNGGALPTYKWFLDSVQVANNTSNTYSNNNWNDSDNVYCQLISSAGCLSQSTATSAVLVLAVPPTPLIITRNISLVLDTNGNAALSPQRIDNGSIDNCGTLNLSLYGQPLGSVCAMINENDSTILTAPAGMVFTSIDFASYGTPTGTCGNFAVGHCNAIKSMRIAQDALLGNNSGKLVALNAVFGDPCGGTPKRYYVQASYSPQAQLTALNCSNIGTDTVILLAADLNGNKASARAVVTVFDISAPVVKTQNITLALDANGHANISAAQVNNGSTDNCGIVNLSLYKAPAGSVCATVNENDSTILTAPAGMVFTSIDFASYGTPTGSCGNFSLSSCNSSYSQYITQNTVLGNNSAKIIAANRIYGDSCNGTVKRLYVQASYSAPLTSFDCSNIGSNNVVLLASDGHGNISSSSATVTVVDTSHPTAITQNITVQLDAIHQATVTAAQINKSSTDNCGIASLSISAGQTSYTCSDVGQTFAVTLLVTDNSGNTSTAIAQVTVKADNNPCCGAPVAVCQTKTAYLDASGNATVTANDVDGGSTFGCGLQSKTISKSAFNCTNLGANNVTLTVTDINNIASSCATTVTILDTIRPTATAQNITVQLDVTHQATVTAAQINNGSTDNCSIASLSISAGQTNYTCSDVGQTFSVTLLITDNSGNASTAVAQVTVKADNNPCCGSPVAVCRNKTIQLDANGNATITASDIDGGSTFGCGLQTLSASQTSFTCANLGPNNVTLTVTDINNVTSSCTATVTVQDNIAPAIICPANVSLTGLAGANINSCGRSITIAAPTTHDNCSVASVVNNFNHTANASGYYPTGTTNVKWTITDGSNLTNTCTQIVTIYSCLHVTATITNTLCSGTSAGAITTTVTGGTPAYNYTWSNGAHTPNLNGLTAGIYKLTVTDATSGSVTASFNVGTITPGKPASPANISGPNRLCPGATNTYSVSAVNGATSYTWVVAQGATIVSGQGSTQVSIHFANNFTSGVIKVSASNCGGTSNNSTLAISLTAIPATPFFVSGTTTICIGDTFTYTSATVAGATGYNWTVPNHATIVSGQGTISVQVKYLTGFTGGNLKVAASNCAGNGGTQNLSINLTHAPAKPGSVSGSSKACNNSIHQYSISAVNNASSYHWTTPAQTTILSGQGTTSIMVQFSAGFTSGSILVYAENCAGNGPTNGVNVTHTNNCGANKTDDEDEIITAPEEVTTFKVQVYPNPFTDQFHLRIEGVSSGEINYRIYDVTGNVLEEVKGAASESDINASTLAPGMYFIHVQQGDNIKVLRIIKTK